jgi:hypothetical protein
MSIPASLQTLLLQFHNRYPLGGLCAELLTIHQNQYVVRAIVQVGNMTVASAMATAAELEAAEERAKERALECLGLAAPVPLTSPPPTLHVPSLNIPDAALNAVASTSGLSQASGLSQTTGAASRRLESREPAEVPASLPDVSQSIAPPLVQPTPPLSAVHLDSSYSNPANVEAPSVANSEAEPSWGQAATGATGTAEPSTQPSSLASPISTLAIEPDQTGSSALPKPEKAAKRKSEQAVEPMVATATASAASVDRSQEVMRIGIEMKRLGWSTEQGREYLKRTYGKRSRQELDDAELLDFLHYLESQPSTLQAPF